MKKINSQTGFSVIELFLVLIVVFIAARTGWYYYNSGNTQITASLASSKIITPKPKIANLSSSPVAQNLTSAAIEADINQVISSNPNGLSAAATLIDLSNNQQYNGGASTTVFKAASSAKVLAAVTFLHEVELGKASLGENIDGVNADVLLQQMIEVSNNQDWLYLDYFLGEKQVTYAKSIGLSTFVGGDVNTMTASDEANLLAQLYESKLLNVSDTNLLLNFMGHTDSTNLIQAALPASCTVYHKYGEILGYLNDASIIDCNGHSYVLVIFTNNGSSSMSKYAGQVSLIHNITHTVYEDVIAR